MRSWRWALIQCDWCPNKEGEMQTNTSRERRHCDGTYREKTPREDGRQRLESCGNTSRKHLAPPEARGDAWNWLSLTVLVRNQPSGHPDFRLLASGTVRQYIFWLSHLVGGIFFTAALGKTYHISEYSSAIKRNKLLRLVTTWINIKITRLCERSQTQNATYCIPFT